MGDSYREEIKKNQGQFRGPGPARPDRDKKASDARSKAIQREQSRKTLRSRAKEKAIQGRLDV